MFVKTWRRSGEPSQSDRRDFRNVSAEGDSVQNMTYILF
jgi:hypothetical protein